MSDPTSPHFKGSDLPKPPGAREITPRSIVVGILVAIVMGCSYPYMVLKLGFGPNISVVAAFFGFLALGIFFKDYTRWENNMVQTAGSAAGQLSFMCVLLAAFDMLRASPNIEFNMQLSFWQSFLWLVTAGLLGVFLSVPMRRHFIVEENLPYPDGIAAGTTLIVLDQRGKKAKHTSRAMFAGLFASAVVMLMTEDAYVLSWFPSVLPLGPAVMQAMGVGINWSLLSVGSGMLVGFRINASLMIGSILSWMIAPYFLLHYGVISELKRNSVLFWVMWPATGMLVAGGITALLLRWSVLARTFKNLRSPALQAGEFPFRWVWIGAGTSAVALVIVQKTLLGLEVWATVVAIILSIPLMLVCTRVLGETNWAPISALSNMMQGIFGVLAPGQIQANMLASGTTGTIATGSESLMQDYRAGAMVGSTPKYMTYMQILGTPIGAAAVSFIYPILRDTYGIVGDNAALTSPISRKWAGFAEVLSKGLEALPPGAIVGMFVGIGLGILLPILETRVNKNWVPSTTGMGIGMLVPFSVILMMFLGGVIDYIWQRKSSASNELFSTPLASGFMAGEAIIGVLIPILVMIGLMHI